MGTANKNAMKQYILREKQNTGEIRIIYEIDEYQDFQYAWLGESIGNEKRKLLLAGAVIETKRGWTLDCWRLSNRLIKIFLSRSEFEKVEK